MRKRAVAFGVIVAILGAGVLAVLRRDAVVAALLPRIVGAATGYDVSIREERFERGHAALIGVHVRNHGEPVLAATRIDVWYSLRDLLPGSAHRYGITAIAIDRPTLTLVRHRDGSYNIALPHAAPEPQLPVLPNRVPLALTVRVRDGSGALRAPFALDPQSRNLAVRDVNLDASIDSSARTHYTLRGAFVETILEPFAAIGTIDVARGYAMHHVRAAAVPLRAIGNYFINSKAASILAGTATNLDLRAYALDVQPFEPIAYHLGGALDVAGASMHVTGLAAPIAGITGRLQIVDDAFFARHLAASLAGVPVRVDGGIIDFSSPQYDFGIVARGDLRALRGAFAFAAAQPVSGLADASVELRGPIGAPEVLARLNAPAAVYRTIPLRDVHAAIVYAASKVTIAPLVATISGARATVRGLLTIGDSGVHSELAVHVDADADELPYLGEIVGNEPMVADAVLDGVGTDFAGSATLASTRSLDRIAAVAQLQRGGVLDIAPLWFHTARGTIDGAYHLDRTHDTSAYWVVAQHVRLATPKRASAFGAALPALPAMDGTLDDLRFQGGGASGIRAVIGGTLRAHDTTIATVRLTHLAATVAGTLADAAIVPVMADGPWGTLQGRGALSLHALAVRGTYHGTLQGLQPFLAGIPASGRIDGGASLAIAPGRVTVQAEGVRLAGADVRGLPVDSVRGTLAIENGVVHVYSADAGVAGGSAVAAGAYATGISLVATHLDGAHLRGLGLPLDAGIVSAEGSIGAGAPLPSFDGGVTVADGRVERYGVAGSSLVRVAGDAAHVDRAIGSIDGTYAYVDGAIGALTSGAPAYDLQAQIPAGDVTRALHTFSLPTYYSDGTYNADFAVDGDGLDPRVRGPLHVPAGSVNGLPFVDATTQLTASPSGVLARNGRVVVGTTALAFLATHRPAISGLQVRSSAADLADFNNFFDTGDTLAGTGALRFDVISQRHRISSSGDVAIAGLRYRNIALGDTRANWSSARSTVRGSLAVASGAGTLHASGSVALATDRSWNRIAEASRYNLTLDVEHADLSTWAATLGYPQVPVTGRVNAGATIVGRYPDLQVTGSSELDDGTIWRLPIESAQLTVASRGRLVEITSGSVVATGITATASGDFGLHPSDPLHVSVYVNSDDVPGLVSQLYRIHVPISGTFESTVTLGGTIAKPTLAAAFDADEATIYGVSVPSIFGQLTLEDGGIELRNAGAQFQHGDIALAGTLPLRLDPFGIGPSNAPVSLDLAIDGLDPGTFDALIGNATKLGGAIDGQLGISGTIGEPKIYGKFAIANGTYASNLERTPITAIGATLEFTRTQASVEKLSAHFGTGTIAGSGSIAFGNGTTFRVDATARGAQLDSPQFGSGTLDGKLALTRVNGAAAELAGNVTLSNATIPFSAFLAATQSGGGAAPAMSLPFGLGFDVSLAAGKNVRVRGSGFGAGLDIGASGAVRLAGTLKAPTLDGRFASTGGTLTYFDRAFRVVTARVSFDPASGIIPTLHASGITHVANGDPDAARNPYGSTDVTIDVDGPINGLRVAFSSNPPGYTNDQILAMIAPFGGLIAGTSFEPLATPSINGVQPLGALSPIPAARAAGTATTGSLSVGEEAFNIVNAQFTAGLLSPLESALSTGLGFQSVNVTLDYYGNVGIAASRVLGRTANLIYSTTFGVPVRQSVGIQMLTSHDTSMLLSFYLQNGNPTIFKTPIASLSSNSSLAVGEPLEGSSGFAFTFQRLFW